jgi:hypothetical protein
LFPLVLIFSASFMAIPESILTALHSKFFIDEDNHFLRVYPLEAEAGEDLPIVAMRLDSHGDPTKGVTVSPVIDPLEIILGEHTDWELHPDVDVTSSFADTQLTLNYDPGQTYARVVGRYSEVIPPHLQLADQATTAEVFEEGLNHEEWMARLGANGLSPELLLAVRQDLLGQGYIPLTDLPVKVKDLDPMVLLTQLAGFMPQ